MTTGGIVRLTVVRGDDGQLGFSLRGGSEHGLGVFISRVQRNSAAELAGLCVGDKLIEANGVSLKNISMSSAVKVLAGHTCLRLVAQRLGRVPGVRCTNEKTTWVDLIHRRMVVEESDPAVSVYSSDGALCRTIHLHLCHSQPCLGLNIRGGREYNLGIYISKLDPGGLAEQGGVKMGDQILSANGVSFENISHYRAVEVLKSQTHVILTIKEAGRYPAYKEMVTELSWINKCSEIAHSFLQGSDSQSSVSSLSSGTPLGSMSGLSQATLPVSLPLGTRMFPEAQFHSEQLWTVSRGSMELLQDSVIREGRKISLLSALSRPCPPIRRTQSHVTVSEEEKRQEIKSPLRRSRTFFSLFPKTDSSGSRCRSSESCRVGRSDQDALTRVREMAVRLLEDEDVSVLIETCQKYLTDRGLQTLVQMLLFILNTPEKLLLLREIRTIVSSEDLLLFNHIVSPSEEEAYDILKSRSCKSSPLCSPQSGHAPRHHLITLVPDSHAAEDLEKQKRVLEDVEQLHLSCCEDQHEPLQTFNPLQDVPLDTYSHVDTFRSSRTSALLPNWLLAENTDSLHTSDYHSVQPDAPSVQSADIGQLPSKKEHSGISTDREEGALHTVVDMPRHKRPLLSQVFGSLKKCHSSTVSPVGQSGQHQKSPCEKHDHSEQKFEFTTVNISKTKQSLGISISGGVESRVQPMVKIERIFPGGAASANKVLQAGFELVSVDGVSLQGVTHQAAVDIIRQAFRNKSFNPMELVVRVPTDFRTCSCHT